MDDIVRKLLVGCQPQNIEVEARIRRQLVTRRSVDALLCTTSIPHSWEELKYSEKRKISKHNRKCTYRSRVYADNIDSEHICKSSIAKEDINEMWCAIHVSVETPMPLMQHALDGVEPITITRRRTKIYNHYVDVVFSEEIRVEIEACDTKEFDTGAMLQVVKIVCTALQNTGSFLSYYDWKTVMHVSGSLFGPFCIDKKQYQKPRTMTFKELAYIAKNLHSWKVTPKADGIRRFLVTVNGRLFSLGAEKEVTYVCTCTNIVENMTILDCEYAENKYYVFDMPVYDGTYCGDDNKRFDQLVNVVSQIQLNRSGFEVKPYETFTSFDALKKIYETFCNYYCIDGLIFYEMDGNYMQHVPKWKMHSTVDLEVRKANNEIMLFTCDNFKYELDFTFDFFMNNEDRGVWEFQYDEGTLVATRFREDKVQGNSKHIVEINLCDSVPGTLFTGRGFYLMRKYHNNVKYRTIKNADDFKATILDIGTGQGGDIGKWKRAKRVYCVEPNRESLDEMLERCNNDERMIVINDTLANINVNVIESKIDIFTAFFCMNQWNANDMRMLKNIIHTKGSKMCRLLVIALTHPKEHKSENFEVVMKTQSSYNVSIHDTRILDINETVVSPNDLTKLMKKCEMHLVKHERLDRNSFMTWEERRLSAMYSLLVYEKTAN